MPQRLADRLFALKTGEEGRIALELHEGDLDRHGLAALQVLRLEDRRHAAAADQVGDAEAIVQHLADFDFIAHGQLALLIDRLSAIEHHVFDAIDPHDLHREIIVGAAFFRQRHQLPAGVLGRERG